MRKLFYIGFLGLILTSRAFAAEEMQWPTLDNIKKYESASVYDRPYSFWENQTDGKKILRNTGAMVGGSLGAMAFLYAMPSSFTNWDKHDKDNPAKKWWDNVSHHPVWDKDDFFLNYVTHPYFGAVYYMGARSAGANAGYSFLYSAALSTFFWEYGVEAFAEKPSIQDLIVTPVCGSILGEGFYMARRTIHENDDTLFGSQVLGHTAVFLMDPMTKITDWIFDSDETTEKPISFISQPIISNHGGVGYGLKMRYTF